VAVGTLVSDGEAWTSVDGTTWTRSSTVDGTLDAQFMDVTAVSNGFVGVGTSEAGAALWTSADGTAWHRVADDPVFADAQMAYVVRADKGLLALGQTIDTEADDINVVWLAPAP